MHAVVKFAYDNKEIKMLVTRDVQFRVNETNIFLNTLFELQTSS